MDNLFRDSKLVALLSRRKCESRCMYPDRAAMEPASEVLAVLLNQTGALSNFVAWTYG
jgi:hypothetical protein